MVRNWLVLFFVFSLQALGGQQAQIIQPVDIQDDAWRTRDWWVPDFQDAMQEQQFSVYGQEVLEKLIDSLYSEDFAYRLNYRMKSLAKILNNNRIALLRSNLEVIAAMPEFLRDTAIADLGLDFVAKTKSPRTSRSLHHLRKLFGDSYEPANWQGKRLLDVETGMGRSVLEIRKFYPQVEAVGMGKFFNKWQQTQHSLFLQSNILESQKKEYLKDHFGKYDIIQAVFTLSRMPEKSFKKALKNLTQYGSPEGYTFLLTPLFRGQSDRIEKYLQEKFGCMATDQRDITPWIHQIEPQFNNKKENLSVYSLIVECPGQ